MKEGSMNHKTLQEMLPVFYDAEFPEPERRIVSEHLAGCESCRNALKRWKAIRASLSGLQLPAASSEAFVSKVMGRITALEEASQPEAAGEPRWSLPRWLLPALGYGFAFTLMFFAIQYRGVPVNTEAVLLADVPQTSQWTFSTEAADVGKLVGLP